jgi:Flp pilus assembly protein TadD
MPEQITYVNVEPLWRRLVLIVPFAAALLGAWYGVRWCIGNTMADYAPDRATAATALRLAPRDPVVHLKLARFSRISFLPEEIPATLAHYEEAARLSPNDYRLWMEYGAALWDAGDGEAGIRALRRAIGLAPHYARPRWHLGNTLLREGRLEEAFTELRRAGDADTTLRPQIFNMAWQVYGGDLPQILAAVGNSPQARGQLAQYLIGLGRLEDAERLWAGLSASEKQEQQEAGAALLRALFSRRQYHAALRVQRDLRAEGASPESILNGGFESDIGPAGVDQFDWQVTSPTPPQFAQVAIDPRTGHSGRSLRIAFNATSNLDFKNVSLLVLVAPSARYRLSFYARTENLKSASTLLTAVLDSTSEPAALLGASAPLAVGTSDWQPVSIEFTTGPRTEAITVALSRPACPGEMCPIFGKVWYDDFDLQRLGGTTAAGARRS